MRKKRIQDIAEYVQVHSARIIVFFLIFLVLWCSIVAFWVNSLFWMLVLFLVPILAFEGWIRLLLFWAYGRRYRFSLFNFLVVDDPVYGLAFRKNCSIKDVDFLIFDRMAFPPGTPRILDLNQNIEQRVDFHVDALGFRGEGFSPKEKSPVLRIFCLGGSTTACTSVGDGLTWPHQLMRYLGSKGYEVEVINGGVPSWYSYHDVLRLQNEVCHDKPDVLLLHQGWNEEFFYSSLSLGKHWKPRMVRNVREEYNLYCPPNRLLSNTFSLFWYLMVRAYLKNLVFSPNMRFDNPDRWKVLMDTRYILAWVENMIELAGLAARHGLLLYTMDYPGLVSLGDSSEERDTYVKNSRLSDLYADYQAVSKKRISHVLSELASVIPCLDVEEDFARYRGEERLALFYDEIHFTPEGCSLFAEALGRRLIRDRDFQMRYEKRKNNETTDTNVKLEPRRVAEIREKTKHNKPYLERFVSKRCEALKSKGKGASDDAMEVPHDRYTTF